MIKLNFLFLVLILLSTENVIASDYQADNSSSSAKYNGPIISPNDFKKGSDSDRIEAAIEAALKSGVYSIEIPRYNIMKEQPVWLIDRAIVLPSDFTMVLKNCLIRLSPGTQDNIITNRGARTDPLSEDKNITITGQGNVILSGGLEAHFDPPGDKSGFRTIGILLYNTKHFIIEGVTMEETQAWAISVENGCAYGRISNINIANTWKYPNQDGVDIRKGCHDIMIENITGTSGDDMVALTGLRNPDLDWRAEVKERNEGKRKPGMQVGGTGWREDDDIYNITINNVKGTTVGKQCCSIIRLLNHDGVKIYNVFINNVMDTAKDREGHTDQAINIGDDSPYWKKQRNQLGETSRIFINNVISNAPTVVRIRGTLKDSRLTNIVGYGENINPRRYKSNGLIQYGDEAKLENVVIDAYQF